MGLKPYASTQRRRQILFGETTGNNNDSGNSNWGWSFTSFRMTLRVESEGNCNRNPQIAFGNDRKMLAEVDAGVGGEGEAEGGAFAGRAGGPDLASVLSDDAAADGEAEAGASHDLGVGGVDLLEAAEDGFELVGVECRGPWSRTSN